MKPTKTASTLTTEQLQARCAFLENQVAELSGKLKWLEGQVRLGQHKRFGSSSEKTHPDQLELSLFNEAEVEATSKQGEPATETITYRRKKKSGQREALLDSLPTETVEYRLSPEEQICPCCGGAMHEMSTEVRREIKTIPAQLKVVEHVRYIYSCRRCEHHEVETPIVTAPMPKPVYPGSLASPSSMAYIMSQKYVEGCPLYRQEKQFERLGFSLSRQTMSNWILYGANQWLKPIYQRMKEILIEKDILHSDETTLQVLNEPGRKATSQSFMWVYRTGRTSEPIILFDYQETRQKEHPARFLKGFKGYLHADGYQGYNDIKDVTLVGCWAHARRKFDEALKALPANLKDAPVPAKEGLQFCNQLFAVDRATHDMTPDERHSYRLKHSTPILEAFSAWLHDQRSKALPKSPFGMAVTYCLNQWERLMGFMKDGLLEIDNNRSERAIKPFVIGRKNWMFSNTPKGANASALIYSVIETAKENNLNPLAYLTYLFEQLPNLDSIEASDLDPLLPWSNTLPLTCRVFKKNN